MHLTSACVLRGRPELALFDSLESHQGCVQLVISTAAGHFPYREHPQLFAAEVTNFISFRRDK